jgi:putative membrane protein
MPLRARQPLAPSRLMARTLGVVAGLGVALATAVPVLAHSAGPLPAPTPLTFALDWSFDPLLQLALVLSLALYLLAVRSIDRAHPATPVPRSRVVLYVLGILVIEIALQSGIGTYDDTLFTDHMVQHMLLTFVAAPLIVLGTPITVLLRAVRPEVRRDVVLPVLESRIVKFISHPLVAGMLFIGVMYATHLTPFFDIALGNDLVHQLEHVLYLGTALLFWWPIIGLDPSPHRMPYPLRILFLFLAFPLMTFLALAIFSAPEVLYPHYATLALPWLSSPLADQQAAGALMWVWGDMTMLASIILVLAAWLRDEERRTARTEGRIDAQRAALREREARQAARLAAEAAGEGTEAG